MSYIRILPRDLFNEADLLKCYARLWIELDSRRGHKAAFTEEAVPAFDIVQIYDSGALTIVNLELTVASQSYQLSRPLNARTPWPLYLSAWEDDDFEEIRVFDENGDLSAEMRKFIGLAT